MKLPRNVETRLGSFIQFYCFDDQIGHAVTDTWNPWMRLKCGLISHVRLGSVIAFIRHHGTIKKMESIFNISYPTVKNRLNAIAAALDRDFEAPSPNLYVLEQIAHGEISVEEALNKLS
jgi:hypothetical protein